MLTLRQAFSNREKVLICVRGKHTGKARDDDVQWADAASLDVLHYAGQRWSESGTPLLLLLSLRSEALATTSSLRTWLTGLHHDLPVTDLTLGPLTLEETLRVLGALATGHSMAASSLDRFADIGRWLFRETRGQPFYLVETLKVLFESQILTLRPSSSGEE